MFVFVKIFDPSEYKKGNVVGRRIAEARREAGFKSREDLAERLKGITAPTLGSWERGETVPQVYDLLAISGATGKPLEFFIVEVKESPPEPKEFRLSGPTNDKAEAERIMKRLQLLEAERSIEEERARNLDERKRLTEEMRKELESLNEWYERESKRPSKD